MTTKRRTGVKFKPSEFRLLNECVMCGKADNIWKGDMCKSCTIDDFARCEMCDIPLRNGAHTFYTYDIKNDHREGETEFKASKEFVREFMYRIIFSNPVNPEGLCADCIGWQSRMKNECAGCGKHFLNEKDTYKTNGNFCIDCIIEAEEQTQNEQETRNGGLEGESLRYSSHTNQGV